MDTSKVILSLTLTALINASLFGSKPNPGKLQLPKEGQKEIVQTTTEVDLLPYWARQTMSMFNLGHKVKILKDDHDSRQKDLKTTVFNYVKKLAQTSHTKTRITVKKHLKVAQFQDLIAEHRKLFVEAFYRPLQSAPVNEIDLKIFYTFVEPYVTYSFFELLGWPVNRELLSIFQKTSIARLQEHLNSYNIVQLLLFIYDEKVSQNPYIKMLQDCSLDLLKIYKDQTGDLFAYAHARSFHLINKTNELEKLRKECDEITATVLESLPKLENLVKMISGPSIDYELKTITEISSRKYKLFKTLSKEISDIKQKHKLTEIEYAEVISILEASTKDLKKAKQKTQPKMSTQKQASLAGRKAAPNTFSTPETQKQMKKEPTPITLKDLDDKFGEDLDAKFGNTISESCNKLELIEIDFDSEEDWEIFIKEADVKFEGESHRHGSHESQEIFFDLESQNTKGQLLTYHVHSKDTPEKITRKIRVTRRIQK